MSKFNKGDICTCSYKLRSWNKEGKGRIIEKKNCKVRIISLLSPSSVNVTLLGLDVYSVYNLDFNRYENIGEFYLKLDIEKTREFKLKNLLK